MAERSLGRVGSTATDARTRTGGLPQDARLRLLAAGALALACASVTQPLLMPVMLVLALGIALAAGLGASGVLRALRVPGVLVLTLVLLLPFTGGGDVLVMLGPLALRTDGVAAAGLIAGRALTIVLISVALLGQLPVAHLLGGLRALGTPAILVDIAAMMHRHLMDIRRDLAAMRLAARLRGEPWRVRISTLRTLGWTLGALLLRSHERAERIWTAMRLRGHARVTDEPLPAPTRGDWLRFTRLLLIALALLIAGAWW
jgi:cobalt/nickel transport system permease protein